MLIDTHCHLEDKAVLARARAAGVQRLINIGCDIKTTQEAIEFGKDEPDVFFSAGVHPHEAGQAEENFLDKLRVLAENPKCVAIGECGLDYYYNHSTQDVQKAVFEAQIALAGELKKPLIIHVRDAYEDCLERLVAGHPTVIHCFSGTRQHAKAFLDLGCYISISGIVTFKNAEELRQVVLETPLERLLVETDAPYLAPMPYRGKPNEPAYVKIVAEKVAEIKQIPVHDVIVQTGKNACGLFGLS